MNAIQKVIGDSVNTWVKSQKRPIPLDVIIRDVTKSELDVAEENIKYHVRALVKKGYLRKACIRTKMAYYVQLRSF